ncbi:MAG: FlgD immunoglobulin-like domain containing protein [Candidatus Krumholzibacteria bacterium]|nr:FlgD immunoglobulin-like domain containing protein [Candidatus Krumholzibacteria bacterium]
MVHVRSREIHVATAAIALLLCVAATAAAQQVSVWVEPAETRIAPGERCTLFVHVDDGVDSLSCAESFLRFDTATVSVVSARLGQLYRASAYPKFFDWRLTASDMVSVTACVLGYRSYIISPGSLFEIVFEALDIGTTDVAIDSATVLDIDRFELDETIGQPGRIVVTTQTGGETPPGGTGRLYNYPNPFNPSTTLVLELPGGNADGRATEVGIYDAAGRTVCRLFRGVAAGRSELRWDGTNDEGAAVGSGCYFAVSSTGPLRLERKLILIR